ncbi:MAG: hypothetical protein Pars92KO_25000 [Parasphingorhabdus sp.]
MHTRGRLQRKGVVTQVIATHIKDNSDLLDMLGNTVNAGGSIDPSADSTAEGTRPERDSLMGPTPALSSQSETIRDALQSARRPRLHTGIDYGSHLLVPVIPARKE